MNRRYRAEIYFYRLMAKKRPINTSKRANKSKRRWGIQDKRRKRLPLRRAVYLLTGPLPQDFNRKVDLAKTPLRLDLLEELEQTKMSSRSIEIIHQ